MLCTGKWIKLFTETVLAFNQHFQHIGLNLQENTNVPFERAENVGVETTLQY
jgi:hypothetical protein